MVSLGKVVHIHRLQNLYSGRIFTVALDHVPSYGLLDGLTDIRRMLEQIASSAPDALLLMRGVAESYFLPYAGRISLILKCSTLSPYHPQTDVWVSSAEDAVRLGADAIAFGLTVGSPRQDQILASLARLVDEAETVGLPVVAHAYPNGEMIPPEERYSLSQVSYASRLAMELGVDIIKTFYTGSAESFSRVVDLVKPTLVVAAGGARLESDLAVLEMAENVVQAGAAGVTFGRNIWQSRNPSGMVRALIQVIHKSIPPHEAILEIDKS
jgi:class I fructose-bisphosphate aldolase